MTQKAQEIHSDIRKEWICLDTQSTMSVFNNKQFFTNIQDSNCVPMEDIKIGARLEIFQTWEQCGTIISMKEE